MVTSSLHTCAHVHMHLKAHIQTHEHEYTIHTYTHWRNKKFIKVWNRRIKLNLKPQNVDTKSPIVFKGSRGRQTFQALCQKSKRHSQDDDKTDRLGNPSWTQTQFNSVEMADMGSFLSSMLCPRTQRDFWSSFNSGVQDAWCRMKSCESWEVRTGEPLTKSPHGPGRLMASLASAVFKMRTVKWQRRRRREQEEMNKA